MTPCVVFAFNRPDKLQRILSALKTQGIDHLIVFVDGPRDNRDAQLVEQCKAVAKAVDWVGKELFFGEQNTGLPGLTDKISTVMNLYGSAVFVEDDCLPMPGFFPFMRQALRHYEAQKRVFSIGAYQALPQEYFKRFPCSLVSSPRFWCWGWGTWQDRWRSIAPYLSRYLELFGSWKNVPNIAGQDLPMMVRACEEGREKSWDINVGVCMLWLGQVQLLPTRGLVRNTGLEGGSHGTQNSWTKNICNRNVCEQPLENIVWLDDVEVTKDYIAGLANLKWFVGGDSQLHRCRRYVEGVTLRLWTKVPTFMKDWLRASLERPKSPE
jgi:hypothetical protein